jgi:hypothetical protein
MDSGLRVSRLRGFPWARGLIVPLVVVLAWFAGCSQQISRDTRAAREVITPDLMSAHVYALASDSMKGRNTPSPELDSAARYINAEFRRIGLAPLAGSYFQTVHLNIVNLGQPNELVITKEGRPRPFAVKTDFTPFEMTASREVEGDLVFAGYGITAPEYRYDDYAGLDVKGKVVLVLRHEPGEDDSSSVFRGKLSTPYSTVPEKVRNAIAHGAVAVLVATDPLNHTLLTPRGFPWPSLSSVIPKDALPVTLAADEARKVPVIHVGRAVIESLFGSVDSLRDLQGRIDRTLMPASFQMSGVLLRVQTTTDITRMQAFNVAGSLEGSDPVGEVVVIGAHYDHVGVSREHQAGDDFIYNGADDNASGTAALLGIARAMSAMPVRPRRTVLFLAFAGEEKGLFGSEYYVRNSLVPLEKTVAMLNFDMVGRNGRDSLYLVGAKESPDLARIVHGVNGDVGMVLIDSELDSGGSDHVSFTEKGVAAVHFFSGLHADYHRVSDNPDRIDMQKVSLVAQLGFLAAWEIANEADQYHLLPKQPTTH